MPTYEYRCEKCGHHFEEFQSITAKPIRKCPKCGKNSVNRLISAGAGFIFKGSGFYLTDYRSDKYKDAAKKDSAAPVSAADSTAKSDGKSSSTDRTAAPADKGTAAPATGTKSENTVKSTAKPTKPAAKGK